MDDLKILLATPDLASKRWIWEQYDHQVMNDTVIKPGGDAALVRVHGTKKALAITTDCTPRYCYADPVEGGKQAVAETWRNLTAVGATPLAITNCLNFGNPEKPEIMGQIVGCLQGMSEACTALDYPIISGNVSLYNETNGSGIQPTPAIGGVGILKDSAKHVTHAIKEGGLSLLLVGETKGHLGASLYLREIHGREEGAPPPVDLASEKKNGDFVRGQIQSGNVAACHDLSDGGLLIAVAEMCLSGGMGAHLVPPPTGEGEYAATLCVSDIGYFFGEDQGRYILTVKAEAKNAVLAEAKKAGIAIAEIGYTGGDQLKLEGIGAETIETLRQLNEHWMPAYMKGNA